MVSHDFSNTYGFSPPTCWSGAVCSNSSGRVKHNYLAAICPRVRFICMRTQKQPLCSSKHTHKQIHNTLSLMQKPLTMFASFLSPSFHPPASGQPTVIIITQTPLITIHTTLMSLSTDTSLYQTIISEHLVAGSCNPISALLNMFV